MEKETEKKEELKAKENGIEERFQNYKLGNGKKRSYKIEFPFKQEVIGRIIKAYRMIRNLSQNALGEQVGVKKSQISKIEKGDKNLTIGTIVRLLKALRAKITFRIELDNKKEVALLEQVVLNEEHNKDNLRETYR